jgi:DNA transformation protein and related proteins
MFGGVGLYRDDVFFAIVSGDVLYFKVGDGNRADYETRRMRQFRPFRDKPQLSMNYYEVPADILEDIEECAEWVQRAVEVAVATKPSPTRRKLAAKKPSPPPQGRRAGTKLKP